MVDNQNQDVLVFQTSPGNGHALLYANALVLSKTRRSEEVEVFVVPEIITDVETFETVYGLNKEELKDAVDGGVVVLGLSDVLNEEKAKFQSCFKKEGIWEQRKFSNNLLWKAVRFTNRENQKKVCFFEWIPSFLGEPAETLGTCLLNHGALELLHFASKVGICTSPNQVGDIFAPQSFLLYSDVTQTLAVKNSLGRFFMSGTHVTVSQGFESEDGMVLDLVKQHSFVSIDDEGAFFARAVQLFNEKNKLRASRQFGALYFASDYLPKLHEKEWKNLLIQYKLINSDDHSILKALDPEEKESIEKRCEQELYNHVTPPLSYDERIRLQNVVENMSLENIREIFSNIVIDSRVNAESIARACYDQMIPVGVIQQLLEKSDFGIRTQIVSNEVRNETVPQINVQEALQKVESLKKLANESSTNSQIAIEHFSQASILLNSIGKQDGIVFNNLAFHLYRQGRVEESIDFMEKAITYFEKEDIKLEIANSKFNLGKILCDRCEFQRGLSLIKEAVEVSNRYMERYSEKTCEYMAELAGQLLHASWLEIQQRNSVKELFEGNKTEIQHGFTESNGIVEEVVQRYAEDTTLQQFFQQHLISCIATRAWTRLFEGKVTESKDLFKQVSLFSVSSLFEIDIALAKLQYLHVRATCLIKCNRRNEAISLYQQGLECFSEKKANASILGEVYNNLATALRLNGEYTEAITRQEQATRIWKSLHGANSVEVGTGYNNLGLLQMEYGDLTKASKALEKAVVIGKREIPHDPRYFSWLNNVGLVSYRMGQFEDAARIFGEVVQLRTGLLGAVNEETAEAHLNLAGAFQQLNHFNEAQIHYEITISSLSQFYGKHPGFSLANAKNNYGMFYLLSPINQDLQRAEKEIREAVAIGRELVSSSHYKVAIWTSNLIRVQFYMKICNDLTLSSFESLLDDSEKVDKDLRRQNPINVDLAGHLEVLAYVAIFNGRLDKAKSSLEEGISIYQNFSSQNQILIDKYRRLLRMVSQSLKAAKLHVLFQVSKDLGQNSQLVRQIQRHIDSLNS